MRPRQIIFLLCFALGGNAAACKSVSVFPLSKKYLSAVTPAHDEQVSPPDARFSLIGIEMCRSDACIDGGICVNKTNTALKYRHWTKTVYFTESFQECEKVNLGSLSISTREYRKSSFIFVNSDDGTAIRNAEVFDGDDLSFSLPDGWPRHPIINALIRLQQFKNIKIFKDERGVQYFYRDNQHFVIYEPLKEFKIGWGVSVSEFFIQDAQYSESDLKAIQFPQQNRIKKTFDAAVRGRQLRKFETQILPAPLIVVYRDFGKGIVDVVQHDAKTGIDLLLLYPEPELWHGNNLLYYLQYPAFVLVPVTGTADLVSYPVRAIDFESVIFVIVCTFTSCRIPGG